MNFENMFGVDGKVVCVTGGGGGIGKGIAGAFVAGGARVYIASRSDLSETAKDWMPWAPASAWHYVPTSRSKRISKSWRLNSRSGKENSMFL